MNLSSTDLKKLEQEVVPHVKNAGIYIYDSWLKISSVSFKNRRDVVTNIDVEVENELREKLHTLLPEAGFIVEEGKSEEQVEYNWVIDPIDGTKNFANQLPMFFTQLALIKNGNPVLGIVLNPVSNQLFSASHENKCYLNGEIVHATVRNAPEESIIDLDFGGTEDISFKVKLFEKIASLFYRVRLTGGYLTPYLLTGAIDAHINMTRLTKIYDFMPGIILTREAGLKSEIIQVDSNDILVNANNTLYEIINNIIKK